MKRENAVIILDYIYCGHTWIFSQTRLVGLFVKEVWYDYCLQIVSTNLTGSLICTREAIRVMKKQPKGGHIFNMDGAGSGGTSTPLTAV